VKRLSLFLLAISYLSPCAFSQSIDIGTNREGVAHPVDLVLDISVDRVQTPAPAGLTVQLSDPAAMGTMSQGSRQTDGSGRVLFLTSEGSHQVRISGPGIEPYEATVQIMRQEGQHAEHITVRSKSSGGQVGIVPSGSPGVVSASRLNVPEKAAKEFKAASKAMEQKDYAEAKKRFTSAAAIYADYSVAYNGLGVAQMASGDAPAARASFEKAVKIDDHFAEAYRNLARLSLADHKYEETDDLLTKSLQTEPLNAWALTYAAYAELQTQKFELAITHARAAHMVPHPELASVHIVAAHAFEATQQPGEALKEYRLYLEEDPNGRDAARAKQAVAKLETSPAP
jgi:tetratricopeptide (TPR) repeat protein